MNSPGLGGPGAGFPGALAAAWTALVLAAAWRVRPAPARLPDNPAPEGPVAEGPVAEGPVADGPVAEGPLPGRSQRLARLVELADRVGAAALRRRKGVSALRRRRTGTALLTFVATLALAPMAAPAAALVGWALPAVMAKRHERRRLSAIAADLPEVVDLLVLAVGAGLTVKLALDRVARRASGPLAAELGRACRQASRGSRLADALDEIPGRAGESLRPLVSALVASERYGAALSASLDRLAGEVRRDRRRRAEEAARKVPVKLLFPLVTCTLPAFALLTVAPLVASGLRSLHL